MCTFIMLHYVLARLQKYTFSFPGTDLSLKLTFFCLPLTLNRIAHFLRKKVAVVNMAESTERVTILIVVGITLLL